MHTKQSVLTTNNLDECIHNKHQANEFCVISTRQHNIVI